MGRGCGRLTMEPIERETDCKTTFQRRKKGLMKKAYEFTTLCGVDTCMIIYGPNFDEQIAQPDTWPKDPRQVHRIIEKYKTKITDTRPKSYDVNEYFKERRSKIDAEISKVQKERLKTLYPTWNDSFNTLGVEELRMFATMLDARLAVCSQRINMLERNQCSKGKAVESDMAIVPHLSSNPRIQLNFMQNMHQGQAPSSPSMQQINDSNMQALYPFQLYKSFQHQMFPFDQNFMKSVEENHGIINSTHQAGAIDRHPQIGLLNEDQVQNNQNSSQGYYNGNPQTIQPYRQDCSTSLLPCQNLEHEATLNTLFSLPNDFQTIGYYNIVQGQMSDYMHGRKK